MFNNFNKLLQLDATSKFVWIMRLKKSTRGIVWPVSRMGSDSRRVMGGSWQLLLLLLLQHFSIRQRHTETKGERSCIYGEQ
jgi:hypothetical protein